MESNCRVRFARLGPIENADIELKPFTVFLGPNGCGKSYLANALFLALTQDTLLLAGSPLEEPSQVEDGVVTAKFGRAALLSRYMEIVSQRLRQSFQCPKVALEGFEAVFDWMPESDVTVVRAKLPQIERAAKESPPEFTYKITWKESSGEEVDVLLKFSPDHMGPPPGVSPVKWWDLSAAAGVAFAFKRPLVSFLPASRSGIMALLPHLMDRTLRASIAGNTPSAEDAFLPPQVASFVRDLSLISRQKQGPFSKIAEYLESNAAGGKWTRPAVNTVSPPKFLFQPAQCDQALDVGLASSGAVELLPLIETLRYLGNSDGSKHVLFIEEPEAHLHPAAQLVVARALVMARNLGLRVVVTTHSDFFVQELNNLIKLHNVVGSKRTIEKLGLDASWALSAADVGAYAFVATGSGSYKPLPVEVEEGGIPVTQINEVIVAQTEQSAALLGLLEKAKKKK